MMSGSSAFLYVSAEKIAWIVREEKYFSAVPNLANEKKLCYPYLIISEWILFIRAFAHIFPTAAVNTGINGRILRQKKG